MSDSHAGRSPLSKRITGRAWRELNALVPKTRWGDSVYTWLRFMSVHKRFPAKNGRLFNDFLYGIKTSSEILDPLRVFTSDKELVKLYVRAIVGEQYNIPTLAVLKSGREARSFEYPARCVIKPTHLSGPVILRRRGEPLDHGRIDTWLRSNYYDNGREANYRSLRPKVIVEPFVFDDDNPNDYKIFCVDGEPRLIQVDSDRHTSHTRSLFDVDWKQLPYSFLYPITQVPPARPENLAPMLEVARKLSAAFSFVRVDLYSNGTHALVGELTHCPENVRGVFRPEGAEAAVSGVLFAKAERELSA